MSTAFLGPAHVVLTRPRNTKVEATPSSRWPLHKRPCSTRAYIARASIGMPNNHGDTSSDDSNHDHDHDGIDEENKERAPADAVLDANEAFYSAFRNRSLDDMAQIWLPESDSVSVLHPSRGLAVGHEQVLSVWAGLFSLGKVTRLDYDVLRLEVKRNMAFCIVLQNVQSERAKQTLGGDRIATNIYQVHRGKWYMVYHGAAPNIVLSEETNGDPEDST